MAEESPDSVPALRCLRWPTVQLPLTHLLPSRTFDFLTRVTLRGDYVGLKECQVWTELHEMLWFMWAPWMCSSLIDICLCLCSCVWATVDHVLNILTARVCLQCHLIWLENVDLQYSNHRGVKQTGPNRWPEACQLSWELSVGENRDVFWLVPFIDEFPRWEEAQSLFHC